MRHVKRIMPAHMRACVRPMEDLSINSRLGALAVSQDASLIVVGLGRSVVVLREEYFEERWLKGPNPNMSEHAIVAQLGNLENDVAVVEIAGNNATVAAAGKEENWAAVLHVVEGSADVNALYMSRDTPIHGIALSPDGTLISMTGRDRKATVYDISGSEWVALHEFDLTVFLFAYGTCVKFSPKGDMLVVGGDMRKCTVWDVAESKPPRDEPPRAPTASSDGRLLKVLGRGGYINAVCFDASGAILALTGGDWKVALYDLANDFALIAEIVMPVQHQHGLAISFPPSPHPPGGPAPLSHPSGHAAFAGLIVAAQSGREAGVLTLTDMATLCPLCELEGVNDVGFARGGLLYCRVGSAVHLYDINSAGDAIIPESRLGGRVRAMAPNHDGSMIALARMAVVRVYASAHNGVVDEVTMASDVVALAYSPHDTPTARVVSRLLDRFHVPHELHARILHDSQLKGKLAALTAKRLVIFAGEPGQLAEVASVKLEHELPGKEEEARHGLRWSADGSMVAVATATHALLINTHTSAIVGSKLRETNAWFSVFRLREHFGPAASGFGDAAFYRECETKEKQLKGLLTQLGVVRVQAYSMAHDCRHIAVGGNGRLFVFDTHTQEATFELPNMGWVMGLVWSADDRFVGIGGHNKTVTVLDVSSGVVFADCGVPRSYWPLVLAFSADGRVVADGNQSFAVYSCDGSRLALSKPLEAAPMLRTSSPLWADDESGSKHENLVVGLVKAHPQARAHSAQRREAARGRRHAPREPLSVRARARARARRASPRLARLVHARAQVALNGLPTKNDGIYRDKGLQPLGNGSARMLDVLIARHKRSLVGRLLEQVPALALLPAGAHEMPSFDLAIRKRDLPTLHLLLVASSRAPLPLRASISKRVIPRLATERLSSAISTFLCDPIVSLERSGALIELASGGVDGAVYRLFSSWGGVGTRLWDDLDAKREAHAHDPPTPAPLGVHVRPKRVPLPGLTGRVALAALTSRACRSHAGTELALFETAVMRAVVHSLWRVHFGRYNGHRVCACALHLLLALVFAAVARDAPAFGAPSGAAVDAAGAAGGTPAPPAVASAAASAAACAHHAAATALVAIAGSTLVPACAHALRARAGERLAALRARDALFAQSALGCVFVALAVLAECAMRLSAVQLRLASAGALGALSVRVGARAALVGAMALLSERLLHALRGVPRLTLALVALSRAARASVSLLCGAGLAVAVLASGLKLLLGAEALGRAQLTVRAPCAATVSRDSKPRQ